MNGIKLLFDLVGECCGFDNYNTEQQEFFLRKKKETEIFSTIPELKESIYNIIDFYFVNKIDYVSKNEFMVKGAKKYIDRNYCQDIGLENVAAAISLNANYLSEIFRKEAEF